MSVLPLDFDSVFESFGQAVDVYEQDGSYVSGLWTRGIKVNRTIEAIVLIADPEQLKILGFGDVSGGALVIHTQNELFYTDPKISSEETKQSYVVVKSYVWRVATKNFQDINANFRSYILLRYQEHDSDE
jgi:hypothetical protein